MASTVWYIGKGSRVISSEAWADYEIVAEDTIWDASNGWAVLTSSLTIDQLNVLNTMRDQFYLNREGPRAYPAPNQIKDYQNSAYIYYARIRDFYQELIDAETGPQGPAGPQGETGDEGPAGQRGSLWFTGSGLPGTIPGATGGDKYLDLDTGNVYTLS